MGKSSKPGASEVTERIAVDFGAAVGVKKLRLLNVLRFKGSSMNGVLSVICVLPCKVSRTEDLVGLKRCLGSIAMQSSLPDLVLVPWFAEQAMRAALIAVFTEHEFTVPVEMPQAATSSMAAVAAGLEVLKEKVGKQQGAWLLFSEQAAIWHPHRVATYRHYLLRGGVIAAAGADVVSCVGAQYVQPTIPGEPLSSAADVNRLLESGGARKVSCFQSSKEELWQCCVRLSAVCDFCRVAPKSVIDHPHSDRALFNFLRTYRSAGGRTLNAAWWSHDQDSLDAGSWLYYFDWVDGLPNQLYGGLLGNASEPSTLIEERDRQLSSDILSRLTLQPGQRVDRNFVTELPLQTMSLRHNIELWLLNTWQATASKALTRTQVEEATGFVMQLLRKAFGGRLPPPEDVWRSTVVALFKAAAKEFELCVER